MNTLSIFKRCFKRGVVLIVILRFVVGWLAIKRLLEKAVPQSLFRLIKWITAAKATGWSSTFAKKSSITFSEFGIYCSNNPFPKYLWFRKRPEIYLCLSPFGKLFESFLCTLWKSRWWDLCYIYWHENVNVLTVLSRALLRTFSKHGAWGFELTCMSTEDVFSDRGSVFVEEFLFVQPAHWVRVSSLQFPNHSTETKLYTAISGKVIG